MVKGLPELYDNICIELNNEKFIDWILNPAIKFCPGMICNASIWYVKKDRWYLDEANYDPLNEEDSTWYARKYIKKYPSSTSHNIMKYFQLENDERLITTTGKERPVILLNSNIDKWLNLTNTTHHVNNWLCIPVFSYKDRHIQNYVLDQQRLNDPTSFYMPPRYNNNPGLTLESSARFYTVQMINEEHLNPIKNMHDGSQMNRPIGLTKTGLEIMMYHFYNQFNLFPELENASTLYTLFKEGVNTILNNTSN